ncbi:MAG: PAAR domain-containing protein [Telluria sp.]
MAGEIIRQGDPTDHGGKVLEGSLTDICHGKPIAYMGHKVSCPKCKGTFPIIEGVLTTTFYGKGVAVAGMKTACGATLVATQFTDIVETGGGAGASAAAARTAAATAAAVVATAAVSAAALEQKKEQKDKKITAVSWSYGDDETPVSGVSRYYVDLNLHVKTENYAPGDTVEILIEDDAGADVLEGVKKLTLRAKVGADGTAKLLNAFAGKTVITVPEEAMA